MKIKKFFSLILALTLSLFAFSLVACGGGDNGDETALKFTEQSGAYAVSGYEGEVTSVVIPETYQGKAVTKILAKAFEGTEIEEITIPKSITEMGSDAFFSCQKLKKVTFTGTIDQWAEIKFVNEHANPISASKKLIINGSEVTTANFTTATKIGDYAFCNYTPLTSVDLGDNVVTVGVSAFDGCSKIANLTLGDKVERFEYRAFGTCSSLTSVVFTDSVTTLCAESFRDCGSLQSIYIPASVTLIEKAAFNYDSALKSAVFEVTEGWFVTQNEVAAFGEEIDPEVMADDEEVAELLSVRLYDDSYYWKRT